MSPVLVLLAERDSALRQLMALGLQNAGCNVRQCSNTLQLMAELYSSPVLSAERALLVLNVEIAVHCVGDLVSMERVRASARAERADFVFVCEFGGRKPLSLPGVDERAVLRVFEKPFDLDDLERLARGYCHPSQHAS